ncbi:MAG TPA: riboflavin synthase [Deltaproteobacteria bacterium]|nr:MAG: riboflavin synthase subunit alpha [Deltaproteobacteria bacterium GWA2_55_82]OGQ65220.1 MAG: riboflavin synthase subunit alpha [Deltaproteobacteria bacterium RIFCSPLOWO2_02_FULL_55_12]OIJ74779.1 MAG: riboflavin synthase subunit alpha [Deltaproteobacteria bacterium GWC2_55_46]HBG45709.1 riboflavin synthase [Deltaproteobacteria bacterium]HCY11117.1 riboflavin synthase [Deltaproteobacteria bacterium]
MFTGIVEGVGTVKHIEKKGTFGKITVETSIVLANVKVGDSISVDGACLTATAINGSSFTADVSGETLKVTTLGELAAGSRVNIELALTLSKPLGGHLVTGHIDGVGVIKKMVSAGDNMELQVSVPAGLMAQIVRKGSITIDGISLTVAEAGHDSVKIAVIPHTLNNTGLLSKKAGSRVNVETDLIGKYVEKFFKKEEGRISEDFLSEHGFIRKG